MTDLFSWQPPAPQPAVPFARGSLTSKEAAESIKGVLGHLEQVVLAAVKASEDGLTCDAAEVITGLAHQTCSARFNQLEKRGLLRRTETRRPTRSGRAANVYVCAGAVA